MLNEKRILVEDIVTIAGDRASPNTEIMSRKEATRSEGLRV